MVWHEMRYLLKVHSQTKTDSPIDISANQIAYEINYCRHF